MDYKYVLKVKSWINRQSFYFYIIFSFEKPLFF